MEYSQEEKLKLQKSLVHRISFQFVIGAINQLVLGIVIYFLGSIAIMTRFDLFILFSLKNLIFWQTLGIIFMGIGGLSFALSGIFWIYYKKPTMVKIVNLAAYLQFPFVFFGPFIGSLLVQNIKLYVSIEQSRLNSQLQSSDPQNNSGDSPKTDEILGENKKAKANANANVNVNINEAIKEVSLLIIGVGLYRLGLLVIGYVFTIALSLLEVSLSYPDISMDSIFLYREILLGLTIFTGIQLGFGFVYSFYWNNQYVKNLAYILTALQFLFIPVGFFASISLINGLRMIYSQKNHRI